jgi:aspartokinase
MSSVKVAKIGGATLNFKSGFDNFRRIVENFGSSKVIIVVSAFGKTTSLLKEAANAAGD